jgi:hypothetical protein
MRPASGLRWLGLLSVGWLWAGSVTTGPVAAQSLQLTPTGSIAAAAELIEVQGDRAYLAAGMTLTVFDVSSPTTPTTLGAYTFQDRIWNFVVVGSLAYVAIDRAGLAILNVSSGRPELRGSLKTPGQAKSVAVSGATALVTDTVSGLDIIDLSDPAKPRLTGSAFLEGFSTDVVIAGPLAFAADRPTGFYVFDVSKPGRVDPVGMSQAAAPNNTMRAQLAVLRAPGEGQQTVLLVAGGMLQMFDVSTASAPAKLAPFRTPGGAVRVALKDQTAYVADGPEGLQVVDLSMPAQPRIVATFKTASPARDVALGNAVVYVALASGEVLILR